jgi:hypothetical protein
MAENDTTSSYASDIGEMQLNKLKYHYYSRNREIYNTL